MWARDPAARSAGGGTRSLPSPCAHPCSDRRVARVCRGLTRVGRGAGSAIREFVDGRIRAQGRRYPRRRRASWPSTIERCRLDHGRHGARRGDRAGGGGTDHDRSTASDRCRRRLHARGLGARRRAARSWLSTSLSPSARRYGEWEGTSPSATWWLRRARSSHRVTSVCFANLGITAVNVHPRPRIGVLSTGDELATGLDPLKPGQIRDANRHALLALVEREGWAPVDLGIVGDDEVALDLAFDRGHVPVRRTRDQRRGERRGSRYREGCPRETVRGDDAVDAGRDQAGEAVRLRRS